VSELVKARPGMILACLLPGVGYLLALFGLPLIRVVIGAFTGMEPGAAFPTLRTWAALLGNPVFIDGLAFSLWLAAAPTVVGLIVSLPLAALMRAGERRRALFGALYRIPLVVPGIVAGFLVLILFDRGGTVSRLLAPFGLQPPRLVRDAWGVGVIIAASWKTVPFMTLIISGALCAINRDVVSAARTLGAGWATTLFRVEIPLARAGITAAALLSFIGSLGAYVIPSLLGPSYPLPLSVLMYNEGFRNGNWPMVYAMGTLISAVAIAILLAYYALIGGLTSRARR